MNPFLSIPVQLNLCCMYHYGASAFHPSLSVLKYQCVRLSRNRLFFCVTAQTRRIKRIQSAQAGGIP
mgnify:FL=1|jgi:hypothetical protein